MNKTERSKSTKRKTVQQIMQDGITTSTIDLQIDECKFFTRYQIISYYSTQDKNTMPYERLCNLEVESVAGIEGWWRDLQSKVKRFFVLVEQDAAKRVINILRGQADLRVGIDRLERYEDNTRKRIIASLLVNSVCRQQQGRMMYSCGSLYVTDNTNFTYPRKLSQLICLQLRVNRHLVLKASTTTFTRCLSGKDVLHHSMKHPVFKLNHPILGKEWGGQTVSPVLIGKTFPAGEDPRNYFVKRKIDPSKHNIVPQFSVKAEYIEHVKPVIQQEIVQKINERYKGLTSLSFRHFEIDSFREYKKPAYRKDLEQFIQSAFHDITIGFENPFQDNPKSQEYILHMQKQMMELVGTDRGLCFANGTERPYDMLIKLVNPQKEEKEDDEEDTENGTEKSKVKNRSDEKDFYTLGSDRNEYGVLQHAEFDGKTTVCGSNEAKRILMELGIKLALKRRNIPTFLATRVQGWKFILGKVIKDSFYGAEMTVTAEGELSLTDWGTEFDGGEGEDLKGFVRQQLKFPHPDMFRSSNNLMALSKEGNSYWLVDTDENPIPDTDRIIETFRRHHHEQAELLAQGYTVSEEENEQSPTVKSLQRVVQSGASNEIKQAKNVDEILGGHLGVRIWRREGLQTEDGTTYDSYAYMVGKNKDTLNFDKSHTFKGAPRTKRVFILHAEDPSKIDSHLEEVWSMLNHPFGRIGEVAAYPYAFKFLREYLEDLMLTRKGLHWDNFNEKNLKGKRLR